MLLRTKRISVGRFLRGSLWTTLAILPCLFGFEAQSQTLAQGPEDRLLVGVPGAALSSVADRHGVDVLAAVGPAERRTALVRIPPGQNRLDVEQALRGDVDVREVEVPERVTLPTLATADRSAVVSGLPSFRSSLALQGTATTPCLTQELSNESWKGFVEQAATQLVDLPAAHAVSPDCGAATVAILDTGVDPDHPLLEGALIDGYDFLEGRRGVPSEWIQPTHSVQAILEETFRARAQHSVQAILEGDGEVVYLQASLGPILDPELTLLGDGIELSDLPPYFGHGTMVAGIVRLVAPAARLMPLRIFNGNGEAHLFDIIRAIYFAVDNGADIINMSFSMETQSSELLQAVQYARSRGVVCVAAAGNQGERARVFPAAFGPVVGVAATTDSDDLSPFSNFGSGKVSLAAPGSGIVSIFPGGLFAAGWGTSFSAPFASGAVALVHRALPEGTTSAHQARVHVLEEGADRLEDLSGLIGSGRLNALGALAAAAN